MREITQKSQVPARRRAAEKAQFAVAVAIDDRFAVNR
jgi:hypothetical protein